MATVILVPIVLLSGVALAVDRHRALEARFDAHLVKPVSPRELLAAIARARKD
jgi:CheY-like chemotaxis protein